ncbi:ABC transporter permease/M1 family aminopeptidase [Neolewinella persica]|uniref:ABC transporter permease/M1 family aminopeptidase n=1 Tax=Neolewinella persica TaxID=70998 RepID=UPI0003680065|nr:M1 family aminopeptidase [Neolewinella persica]
MLLQIAKFEFANRLRQPVTYLYFLVMLLCSLGAVDFIFEGRLGQVKTNAPYVVATSMGIFSAFFMLIISLVMGEAVLRDYRHGMASILFTKPLKKRDYLFGRFLGSWLIVVLIFISLPLGMLLGERMPWREASDLLAFDASVYFRPFFFLIVPTLFMSAAVFFVTGALSKKLLVVYTQGILFFIVYLIAMIASRDSVDPFWGSLLDPFSFETINNLIKFQAPEERNSFALPFTGILLVNRVFWTSIGVLVLSLGYRRFNFSLVGASRSKLQVIPAEEMGQAENVYGKITLFPAPAPTRTTWLLQLFHLTRFYCQSVLKEVSFWAIVVCAGAIIFINGISLGSLHGTSSFPTTYLVVEEIQELAIAFFLIIMVFFTGELIWKERSLKADLLLDAYPTAIGLKPLGKYFGLLLIYGLLILVLIGSGMVFQLLAGYTNLNPGLYLSGFFGATFKLLALFTAASFFIHALTNKKAVGFLGSLLFPILSVLPYPIGFHHPLLRFGSGDLGIYSEMNGFSGSWELFAGLTVYWSAAAVILLLGSILLFVKGEQVLLWKRIRMIRHRLSKPMIIGLLSATLLMGSSGGHLYHQINIRNTYFSPAEKEAMRANYEQTLKQYEHLPQPEIVAVNLKTELYPSRRAYTVEGYYVLKNKTAAAIGNLHVQEYPDDQVTMEHMGLSVANTPDTAHQRFGHCIYVLAKKMLPGDSIKLSFRQTFTAQNYMEREVINIVENGTFFSNDQLPSLGYNRSIELSEEDARAAYGLSERSDKAAKDDPFALRQSNTGADAHLVRFEMIVGTEKDQTAIAPGDLLEEWTDNDRRYFHYRMPAPMLHFYAVVSARYELSREQWTSSEGVVVDLEVYYHPGHEQNVGRMQRALKVSLDYHTKAFSQYPYHQVRIMEFPRYRSFAQSFPGTIPTSEAQGFMLDLNDEQAVDMASFVVAHELAHQWWGMQVQAANVEGRHLILESLAQYSALMILRRLYSEDKIRQFLEREQRLYLQARAASQVRERPLAEVQDQQYIYYKKGAINLYALQGYISEDSLNLALRRFVQHWSLPADKPTADRYATTDDLLGYFREVTPDSLQYLITDLFETVTLCDNKILDGSFVASSKDSFRVQLTIETHKFRVNTEGQSVPVSANDWIDVGIYGQDRFGADSLLYLKKHLFSELETNLKIDVGHKPVWAAIDPYGVLIDRIVENNRVVLSD